MSDPTPDTLVAMTTTATAWFDVSNSRSVVESAKSNHNNVIQVTKDRACMEHAHAEAPPGDAADGSGLVRRDREILAFERQWWKYAGAKEQAIRELFDMSSTRYYQVLNSLIDNPSALAADPMLVKRLRRLRAARQRQRSARRLGIEV
jgi:hypothetical protein